MSDRDSAYIFSKAFELVVEHVPPKKRETCAKELWQMSLDYDFAPSDMNIDKVLMKLGLAREGIDKDYPDETTVLYGPVRKKRTL